MSSCCEKKAESKGVGVGGLAMRVIPYVLAVMLFVAGYLVGVAKTASRIQDQQAERAAKQFKAIAEKFNERAK